MPLDLSDSKYTRKHTMETSNDTFSLEVRELDVPMSDGSNYIDWAANITNSEGDTFVMYIQNGKCTIAGFDGEFTKEEEKQMAEAVYNLLGIYEEKTGVDVRTISPTYTNEGGKDISDTFYKSLRGMVEFEDQGGFFANWANKTNKYLLQIVPGSIEVDQSVVDEYDKMDIEDFKDFTDKFKEDEESALKAFKLKDIRKWFDDIGGDGKSFVDMMESCNKGVLVEKFNNIDFSNIKTMLGTLDLSPAAEKFKNTLDETIKENTKDSFSLSVEDHEFER